MIVTNTGNSHLAHRHRDPASAVLPGPGVVAPRDPADPLAATRSGNPALRLSLHRPEPGVVVVRVHGEIDMATAPRLTEMIRQRLTAAVLRAVVLDLSEVGFFSSAGLELLLHAQRRCDCRGVPLHLVPGTGAVARMLHLTGLTGRFSTHATAAEAVAALPAPD